MNDALGNRIKEIIWARVVEAWVIDPVGGLRLVPETYKSLRECGIYRPDFRKAVDELVRSGWIAVIDAGGVVGLTISERAQGIVATLVEVRGLEPDWAIDVLADLPVNEMIGFVTKVIIAPLGEGK